MGTLKAITKKTADHGDWNGEGVALWWLGQAGFLIRRKKLTLLIDPYLSDVLAVKYKGKKYPHVRMMPPPVDPESLTKIDYYLSSHAHSDHLDPGLIPIIVKNNPECRFILPAASAMTAQERGVPKDRMLFLDDGESLSIDDETKIFGIQAAHEEPLTDEKGRAVFLGFVLKLGSLGIYHSGDCIPYPGLEEKISLHKPTLMLMPVNGRKKELTADGVAGNFTLEEALKLSETAGSSFMIPHHYGMFDFNTISPDMLYRTIRERKLTEKVFPAEINTLYQLEE